MAARAVSTCSVSRACTSSVLSCSATLASTRARRSPSAILFATSFIISRSSSASRSRFFRSSFDFSLLSRSRIRCCARNPNFSPRSRSSSLLTMPAAGAAASRRAVGRAVLRAKLGENQRTNWSSHPPSSAQVSPRPRRGPARHTSREQRRSAACGGSAGKGGQLSAGCGKGSGAGKAVDSANCMDHLLSALPAARGFKRGGTSMFSSGQEFGVKSTLYTCWTLLDIYLSTLIRL